MEQRSYSGPTVQQQGLPADSRQASVHLCGFDISGVSIAGQVGVQGCQSAPGSVTALRMLSAHFNVVLML